MADDRAAGEPAGPADPAPGGASPGVPPVLDLAFDSGTLHVLRAQLRAHAGRAGLAEDRTADVVLAVHELAANTISHGKGEGRLRVWNLAGALHCQVDDGDLPESEGPAALLDSLSCPPGHGLWVARQVADQMQTLSSPRGTRVTLTFRPRP